MNTHLRCWTPGVHTGFSAWGGGGGGETFRNKCYQCRSTVLTGAVSLEQQYSNSITFMNIIMEFGNEYNYLDAFKNHVCVLFFHIPSKINLFTNVSAPLGYNTVLYTLTSLCSYKLHANIIRTFVCFKHTMQCFFSSLSPTHPSLPFHDSHGKGERLWDTVLATPVHYNEVV